MCNRACMEFGRTVIQKDDVAGKDVIEVGATNINGSLRPHVESLRPRKYVGVDISEGPGVDQIANVTTLLDHFSYDSFDVAIATEVLEHVSDWRKAVSNLKHIVKPGGRLILTAPSKGCGFHGCPEDHWRYELEDFKNVFSDFSIEELWKSPAIEGVFLKARRPNTLIEFDTSRYKLYSIMKGRRTLHNRGFLIYIFYLRMLARLFRKSPFLLRHLFTGVPLLTVVTWINHPPPDCPR